MKDTTYILPNDVSAHDDGYNSFGFAVIGSLLTNYLPFVLCVTYLLTMTLPSVVSAYLFAVIRYGYLFHMALKSQLSKYLM